MQGILLIWWLQQAHGCALIHVDFGLLGSSGTDRVWYPPTNRVTDPWQQGIRASWPTHPPVPSAIWLIIVVLVRPLNVQLSNQLRDHSLKDKWHLTLPYYLFILKHQSTLLVCQFRNGMFSIVYKGLKINTKFCDDAWEIPIIVPCFVMARSTFNSQNFVLIWRHFLQQETSVHARWGHLCFTMLFDSKAISAGMHRPSLKSKTGRRKIEGNA